MDDVRDHSDPDPVQSSDSHGLGVAQRDRAGAGRGLVASLASGGITYRRLDPAFAAELDMLSMTIDEYERILVGDEPSVITTDNTVG